MVYGHIYLRVWWWYTVAAYVHITRRQREREGERERERKARRGGQRSRVALSVYHAVFAITFDPRPMSFSLPLVRRLSSVLAAVPFRRSS